MHCKSHRKGGNANRNRNVGLERAEDLLASGAANISLHGGAGEHALLLCSLGPDAMFIRSFGDHF